MKAFIAGFGRETCRRDVSTSSSRVAQPNGFDRLRTLSEAEGPKGGGLIMEPRGLMNDLVLKF